VEVCGGWLSCRCDMCTIFPWPPTRYRKARQSNPHPQQARRKVRHAESSIYRVVCSSCGSATGAFDASRVRAVDYSDVLGEACQRVVSLPASHPRRYGRVLSVSSLSRLGVQSIFLGVLSLSLSLSDAVVRERMLVHSRTLMTTLRSWFSSLLSPPPGGIVCDVRSSLLLGECCGEWGVLSLVLGALSFLLVVPLLRVVVNVCVCVCVCVLSR
jgi:hypothetical protein